MKVTKRSRLVFVAGFLHSCVTTSCFAAKQEASLLMIGNSFTSANNLEEMIEAMLKEDAEYGQNVYAMEFRKPASRFRDDVQNDKIRSTIAERPWTWVILQEQSQIPGFYDIGGNDEFEMSLTSAVTMNQWIANAQAETILLMTWGQRHADPMNPGLFPDYPSMQKRLTTGYIKMQDKVSTAERPVRIAPAGLAFQAVYDSDSSNFGKLYGLDGKHPSLEGSYLVACVVFGTLSGKDPRNIKYKPKELSAERQETLRALAGDTVVKFNRENEVNRKSFESKAADNIKKGEKKTYVPASDDDDSASRLNRSTLWFIPVMGALFIVMALKHKSTKQSSYTDSVIYSQIPHNNSNNHTMELVDLPDKKSSLV